MKYLVQMNVDIPRELPAQERSEIVAREKEYSQQLQHQGK